MNANLFKPRNLVVIVLIAILANVAFSGVKRKLSSSGSSSDQSVIG